MACENSACESEGTGFRYVAFDYATPAAAQVQGSSLTKVTRTKHPVLRKSSNYHYFVEYKEMTIKSIRNANIGSEVTTICWEATTSQITAGETSGGLAIAVGVFWD